MRQIYPSDVTREQFSLIEADLLAATKKTGLHKYDIYDIFHAILYRKREGCRWHSLPHDCLKWENCYRSYDVWRQLANTASAVLH